MTGREADLMSKRPERPLARRLVLHVRTREDVEAELQVSLDLATAMDIQLTTLFVFPRSLGTKPHLLLHFIASSIGEH